MRLDKKFSAKLQKSPQKFAIVAEMIVTNGELPRRINLRSAAQARTAGAGRARKPATAPIPIANAGV